MNRIKNIATFIVLGVFLFNVIVSGIVYIDFKINQVYIAANDCIEKDLEVNTCQGSCHLKQEIKKVNNQTQSDNEVVIPSNHFTSLICDANPTKINIIQPSKILESTVFIGANPSNGFLSIQKQPPIA